MSQNNDWLILLVFGLLGWFLLGFSAISCISAQNKPVISTTQPATNVQTSQDISALKVQILAEVDQRVKIQVADNIDKLIEASVNATVKGLELNYTKTLNVDIWTNRLLVAGCFIFAGVVCWFTYRTTLKQAVSIAHNAYEEGRKARIARENGCETPP